MSDKQCKIALYHRDAAYVPYDVPAEKILGAIITSPPYNIGMDYGGGGPEDRFESYLDYMDFISNRIKPWISRLIPRGSVFLNVASTGSLGPHNGLTIAQHVARKCDLEIRKHIIWTKSIAVHLGRRDREIVLKMLDKYDLNKGERGLLEKLTRKFGVGHYSPSGGSIYPSTTKEDLFILSREDEEPLLRKYNGYAGIQHSCGSNVARFGLKKRDTGDVVYFPHDTIRDRKVRHVTAWPIPFALYMADLSHPDGCLMDPFAGSGTLGIAAAMRGRDAILIEKSKKMYKTAVRSLLDARKEHPFELRGDPTRTTFAPIRLLDPTGEESTEVPLFNSKS